MEMRSAFSSGNWLTGIRFGLKLVRARSLRIMAIPGARSGLVPNICWGIRPISSVASMPVSSLPA
ncbi:hypothetical protein D3C72_2169290 [compost metagenome]